MHIEYDPAKRLETLSRRGLDLADAVHVFNDPHRTYPDDRQEYGEPRFITVGNLRARLVYIAWTPRGDGRRIISMRKANDREIARYQF